MVQLCVLCCSRAAGGDNPLEASTLWFSITVDSDILAGTQQGEPLVDWRIVVAPPLEIANQLPIPGSLLVWEQQKVGAPGPSSELFTACSFRGLYKSRQAR